MCTCMVLTATLTGPKQNSESSRKFWKLIKMSYWALHNLLMFPVIFFLKTTGGIKRSFKCSGGCNWWAATHRGS